MSQETTASGSEIQPDTGPYFATYAMTRESDNIVQDILVCLNTFKMSGYYFVELEADSNCAPGKRYNSVTGTFDVVAEEESSSTGESTTS